jgi:hypothetical protein
VNLVNWEGSALLGPGSEWFWSMAQFVLVAGSLLGIYYQLRAQRSASLYDQSAALTREWFDEGFSVSRLAFLIELEGRPRDSDLPSSSLEVGAFFERLGYLVARKHVRSVDVWHQLRFEIGAWWALLEPGVRHERATSGTPGIMTWFEKLELEMRRLDREMVGKEQVITAGDDEIRQWIEQITTWFRLRADARNGVLPARRAAPERQAVTQAERPNAKRGARRVAPPAAGSARSGSPAGRSPRGHGAG